MQSVDLTYEWNDVALLTDQRAYTFICKTMLQIPEHAITELQEIILLDWENQSQQKHTFDGSMQLQIGYLDQQQQKAALRIDIPLQGDLEDVWQSNATARLLYGKGKVTDACLLLETVLQIPRMPELKRSQVAVGPFHMEELLELPEDWPGCEELEATAAILQIEESVVQQQKLYLSGVYQLAVVYQNEAQIGEQLFAYEQQRPAQLMVPVPAGVAQLEGIIPFYHNLTAQILDDKRILLIGDGMLYTEAVSDAPAAQQSRPAFDAAQPKLQQEQQEESCPEESQTLQQNIRLETILRQLIEALQQHEQETAKKQQNAVRPEKTDQWIQQKKPQPTEPQPQEPAAEPTAQPMQKQPAPNRPPSVVNSRGSRRANLSKYMRNLNSSVQTPKSMRNFEILAESEGTKISQTNQITEE